MIFLGRFLLIGLAGVAVAAGDASTTWQLHFDAAEAAWRKNKWREARDTFEFALRATESFPPDDPRTLKTLEALIVPYRQTGDPQRAIAVAERALAMRDVEGSSPKPTIKILRQLGGLYKHTGRLELSETTMRRWVALAEPLGGQLLTGALDELARVIEQRRPDDVEPEQLFLRVLALEEESGRPSYSNLGYYYLRNKSFEEAAAMFSKEIERHSAQQGPSPHHLYDMNMVLVRAYLNVERRDEALQAALRGLELSERIDAGAEGRLITALRTVAAILMAAEDFEPARVYLLRAEQLIQAHGSLERHVPQLRRDLERLRVGLEGRRESDSNTAAEAESTCPQPEHSETERLWAELRSLAGRGLRVETLELAEQALIVAESEHGRGSVEVSRVLNTMAYNLSAQGKGNEALNRYLESHEALQQAISNDDPRLVRSLGRIANQLSVQGRYDEAEVYLLRSLEQAELSHSPRAIAGALEDLGDLNRKRESSARAEGFFARAAELWGQIDGPLSKREIYSLQKLAWSYMDQEKFDKAEALLNSIIADAEELGPVQSSLLRGPRSQLSQLHDRMGRKPSN